MSSKQFNEITRKLNTLQKQPLDINPISSFELKYPKMLRIKYNLKFWIKLPQNVSDVNTI